jgi:hypothetical protein
MDSTPSGPQANTNQGNSADVKAPMDRPRANTDQGSAEMKTLEEALSGLVGEGPSDWRTKMASFDALRGVEPSPYTMPRPADLKGKIEFLSDTPPPGRRASRGLTLLSIVGFIGVGCILAWQFYDEAAKETLASWASQLGWVQPLSGRKPPPGAGLKIAERPNSRALQEPAPDLPQAASAAQTAPDIGAPPAPAASSPEVQQALKVMALNLADLRQTVNRLEVIARDLADLRQTVSQMVVGQEQMTRDIATLQAAERDLRSMISAPKPAAAPARRPVQKPRPQAKPQISAVPPPPPKPPPQATPQILTAPSPTPSSVESAPPPPVRTGFPIQDANDDAWREWSRSHQRQ